jgi:hypothetical protein
MRRHEETEKELRAKFEDLKARGVPTWPSEFCKYAGIHRTYLYTFTELAAEIAAYGRETRPDKARRGKWLTTEEAKGRGVDARMRREHARWSREMPEVLSRLAEAEQLAASRGEESADLRGRLDRLSRMYELLMLLAVEAGVNPSEIERIQALVGS